MTAFSRYPIGKNVFELDWDILIILDTCRVDALNEVASDYPFLDDIAAITSVGSTSSEWIANTFTTDYLAEVKETVYLSANAYAEKVLQDCIFPDTSRGLSWSNWKTLAADDLLDLDQPWKYAPEPMHGHTRPHFVTDRAIQIMRQTNPGQLVIHYSQPHHPYTAVADEQNRDTLHPYEGEPFDYLREGGELERVWNAYLENLRMVLDSVELLLENVDADTVAISADHGEAFGEWGVYGHPIGIPHPKIKKVPWTTTHAEDTESYEPQFERSGQMRQAQQQLRDLGYL